MGTMNQAVKIVTVSIGLLALGLLAINVRMWILGQPSVASDLGFPVPKEASEETRPAHADETNPNPIPTARSYFDMSRATPATTSSLDVTNASVQEEIFRKARAGDAISQFNLALLYDQGTAIPEDPREAVRWYTKAAEQDFVPAQRNLAYMYDVGRGVDQSDVEAAAWYRRAAEQGDAGGQNNLAGMYYLGRGVEKDFDAAAYWFSRSAEQGDAGAQFNLARLYREGYLGDPDYRLAYFWCHVASKGLASEVSAALAIKCRNEAASHLSAEHAAELSDAAEAWKPGGPTP